MTRGTKAAVSGGAAVGWIALSAWAALAAGASLEVSTGTAPYRNCVAPEERPYVCDVGEAKPLSLQSFRQIFEVDSAVRSTVARIGMPTYAELQKVDVEEPWVSWELRAYYVEYNKMLVFGRAMILGNPQISLVRHEGPIPPEKLAMLTARVMPVGSATDAARRAEDAAALAEQEADRAERAADESEGAAAGLDRSFRRSLVKH